MAEAVAEVLRRFAHQGVAIEFRIPEGEIEFGDWTGEPQSGEPVLVRAYAPLQANAEALRLEIERAVWPLGMIARDAGLTLPELTIRPIRSRDWAELWKAHYRPLRVGKRLVVVPAWERPDLAPEDVPVIMDPGQAFGTGTHPSTQLCLAAIEKHLRVGGRVLDLGCGSGILSIAAIKLGADHAEGLDTDAAAVRATRENATANGVGDRVHAAQGSLAEALGRAPYDLVVANILAKVLITMLGDGLPRALSRNGILILSGILVEQAGEVRAAVVEAGMRVAAEEQAGDWAALVVRRMHEVSSAPTCRSS